MSFWNFLTDVESWTGSAAWTGSEGHPAGCLSGGNGFDQGRVVSIVTVDTDPCSMWYRVKSTTDDSLAAGTIIVRLSANAVTRLEVEIEIAVEQAGLPYDTGWLKTSGLLANETVTGLSIVTDAGTSNGYTVYVDTVYVAEAEPGGSEFTHSAGGVPGAVMI